MAALGSANNFWVDLNSFGKLALAYSLLHAIEPNFFREFLINNSTVVNPFSFPTATARLFL